MTQGKVVEGGPLIERIPLPIDELRVLASLTIELTRLRQNECKHLAVENVGPEIWQKLLAATYPAPDFYKAPQTDLP